MKKAALLYSLNARCDIQRIHCHQYPQFKLNYNCLFFKNFILFHLILLCLASYNFDIYEDFNLKKRLVRMGSYLRITDKVYQAKVFTYV